MSSAPEVVGGALAIAGCAVAVLATLAMWFAPTVDDRFHLLAPVTTVAAPLIAAGLIVYNGLSLTSGQIALIAGILLASGPAITASIARAKTERERPGGNEEPE
jgi:multicomponent Na+:H+ antiporter subunit G